MVAQIYAVIQPLTGPMKNVKKQLVTRLQTIQKGWRARQHALKEVGYKQLQTVRSAFVYNCPPSTCGYAPKTQACNLRICPFCHARRVSAAYERIRTLRDANPYGQVVSWRMYMGHKDAQARIYLDADMGLEGTFLTEVYPQHRKFRREFQKEYMADAIGGVYWYSIAPYTYQELAADGSLGRWNGLHGCCAVMPPNWKSWQSSNVRVIKQPDDYQLAWLVGRCFQYRQNWLSSDAEIMSTFLNATHGDVFLTAFGKLAPNGGHK